VKAIKQRAIVVAAPRRAKARRSTAYTAGSPVQEPDMKIRDERPADRDAIHALTRAAFADAPHSGHPVCGAQARIDAVQQNTCERRADVMPTSAI